MSQNLESHVLLRIGTGAPYRLDRSACRRSSPSDDGASDDFVLLGPPDEVGPHLSLDQVRSALQIPPRLHLDLYTDDQAREVKRLIALGATEIHWDKRPPDADYVILADPEGNRPCVVDTAH